MFWGGVSDDDRAGSQIASHPSGCDSIEVSPTNTKKEEASRSTRKSLNFEILHNKDNTPKDGHSVVGLKARIGLEETEVTSPVKSTLEISTYEEEGYLDLGSKKNIKPKAKGNLKKLAREKGPIDVIMTSQERIVGIKRAGELEKLEVEENRKTKKKYEQNTKEMAVAAEQHRREP